MRTTMAQTSSNNGGINQVLVEGTGNVRTFILNRSKQLNALSFQMGRGRAFCAGGDLSLVFSHQSNWKIGANYFQKQYTLNYVMATYSKPQVSILNGIVMGGGAGVSIHGRFRVATEKLDGAEMLACGLATHFVSSDKLPPLEQALVKVNTSDPDAISAIISHFSHIPKLKDESPYHKMKIINRCFSRRTIEEIISTLESEALDTKGDWISSTIQSLKKSSPISLKISLRSIREGRLQDVGNCLVHEYRMVCHVLRAEFSKDLFEGCRAILVDKDKNPKWEPSRLELISDDDVDRYFSKIDDENWEDLKLPPRSNLPPYAIAKL
ncbi:3-hydroxyisobutyryl-CoA hydrolase 1 [Capsicum annuum]|nr:3-hydroxyisobutyryl-CoA hydrolase 1 [Capsicum annuum]